MRIATYNIHRAVGTDGVEDLDRIVALLREINADLVALQEVGFRSQSSLDVARHLADRLDVTLIPGITLSDDAGDYGNAVLTSLPVQTVKRHNISVAGREPRGVLDVMLSVRKTTLRVLATHLGLSVAERRQQLAAIESMLPDAPTDIEVLLGDFNDWIPRSRALRGVQRYFSAGAGAHATFPARWPILGLDRIWCRPDTALTRTYVHRSRLARKASDHLPLVAELSLDETRNRITAPIGAR